jgi:hypothetical protein
MPTQYFSELSVFTELPNHLQDMVAKIEGRAGLRIEAEWSCKKTMACEFRKGKAVIRVPAAGPLRKASVFHELLHLKRYFVDGVPKLVYCDDDHEFEDENDAQTPEQFQCLDNQIEHLFIVPTELARYRKERSYWEERMDKSLDLMRAPSDVLLAWEFIHRVLNGGALTDKVQALVEPFGLVEIRDRFHQAVDESKEAATRCIFEEFAPEKIPRACLDYFARPGSLPLLQHRI